MTGTVVDALQDATAALNNATASLNALQGSIAAKATAAQTAATTVINNFLARPAVQGIWCDPVNGNDANDGLTAATAKKSLDTILVSIGTTATAITLLNDALISIRTNLYASLTITGAQASPAAPGFIPMNRKLSFLGTALNSPSPGIGTFSSGLWMLGPNVQLDNLTFDLPVQPAGQNYSDHLRSDFGTNVATNNCTLIVDGAAAGALFGSTGNTMDARLDLALGSGASGHVFTGIGAGGNPNNSFFYRSNVTSA